MQQVELNSEQFIKSFRHTESMFLTLQRPQIVVVEREKVDYKH